MVYFWSGISENHPTSGPQVPAGKTQISWDVLENPILGAGENGIMLERKDISADVLNIPPPIMKYKQFNLSSSHVRSLIMRIWRFWWNYDLGFFFVFWFFVSANSNVLTN